MLKRIRLPLIARRSITTRLLTSTRPLSAELAVLDAVEGEPEPYDPAKYSTVRSWASPSSSNPATGQPRQFVSIPNLLPADAAFDGTANINNLYPTSGILDSISMIGICLRRTEHIPRAYSIFRQLLSDYNAGLRPLPDADLFGRVIEGVSSLGQEGMPQHMRWRSKAERMVEQWEEVHFAKPASEINYQAVLEKRGASVYQGWFNGLILSQSPLEPLIGYFENGSLRVDDLLPGVRPENKAIAMKALKELYQKTRMQSLAEAISAVEGREKELEEKLARDIVPELRPILAKEGSSKKSDMIKDAEARSAITNLRGALGVLSDSAPPVIRQRALEQSSLEAARLDLENAYNEEAAGAMKRSGQLTGVKLQAWMHEWVVALTEKIKEGIAELEEKSKAQPDLPESKGTRRNNVTGKKQMLHMYLQVLPPERLALVTVLEVMRGVGGTGISDGIKVVRAMLLIGRAIEVEHHAQLIRDMSGTESRSWNSLLDYKTQQPSSHLIQAAWEKIGQDVKDGGLRHGEVDWSEIWTPPWSQQAHLDLGSYLLIALLQTARVNRTAIDPQTKEEVSEVQPAFAHSYEYYKGRKLGVVRLNPAVASRLATDRLPSVVKPRHLPMLVEPRKWKGFEVGGYLMHKVPIMRVRDYVEQAHLLDEAIKAGHAEPIMHGLDVLSSTAWKINRRVFELILRNWNEGNAIADIPASEANSVYEFPERPAMEADPRIRSNYVTAFKEVLNRQKKDHNERCKINYTLEVARAFLHDTFYLPHNMDFRGRSYPIPPYLSPVGDDLNRGLLLFAEGRELGREGVRWLQIHLANVYGYDKLSFDERARFAEDHVEDIFDSADNPTSGRKWWLNAEDPWQCLAACFELADALRSPDPTKHVSHFPVHQDGTCNGMQHYAALGGDVRGARAVNLEDGDRPADIYTRVVEIVNRVIEEDKKLGSEIALLIKEPMTRKVVKQTVMTTVYGVTFIGARDQIAKQLTARGDIAKNHVFTVSSYVAKTVLSCIGDLFSGARDIQDWLTTSARLISRSIPPTRLAQATTPDGKKKMAAARIPRELMTAVTWTTPLGLPVVQPYRKQNKRQVMTSMQSVFVHDPHEPTEVSTVKQANAFPPNFVHSLDATHMFLTALRCKQNHVAFASVHDSYWTHAATVGEMSSLIRDSFIHLHQADLIGQLREEFIERYGENYIPVANARAISKSVQERSVKERIRREKVRSVLDADINKVPADEATQANLVQAEIEVLGEEPDVEVKEDEDESVEDAAIDGKEIERLAAKAAEKELKIVKVNGMSFIQLKDLLPPKPQRGQFNVEKIRTSQYFFS